MNDDLEDVSVKSSEMDEFGEQKPKGYSNTVHIEMSPSEREDEQNAEIEVIEEEYQSEDLNRFADGQ